MQNDSSTRPMPTVLESIVSGRRSHLPEIQARISHVDPARLPRSTRSLFHALGGRSDGGPALRGECALYHGVQVLLTVAWNDPRGLPP